MHTGNLCEKSLLKPASRRLRSRRLKPQRRHGPNNRSIMVASWRDYAAAIPVCCEGLLLGWLNQHVRHGETWIEGVKSDILGMELSVLRGLAPILNSQRPQLIVEVHAGVSRPELVALLNELGYHGKPLPLEPVAGETEAQLIDNRIYHFPVA
jgi:hypothetical protein